MTGVNGKRVLVTLSPSEERMARKLAKANALPVATYLRRLIVLGMRAEQEASGQ